MKKKERLQALAEAPLIGRAREKERLSRALLKGAFPQSLLITGARGVGKRRMALYAAQLLLCKNPGGNGPCEQCQDCRLARSLSHPDLHVYVPHKSIGDGSIDTQIDKIDEEIEGELDRFRRNALYVLPESSGAYYVATIKSVARKAYQKAYRNGGRKVLILTAAERLSAFSHSTEAANALLKLIEEPPENTHFIFTSATPHQLLDTIRSRLTEIRLPPLSEEEVGQILSNAKLPDGQGENGDGAPPRYTGGSITEALDWLDQEWQEQQKAAIELVDAALSQDHLSRYEMVRNHGSKGARGDFLTLMEHVELIAYQCSSLATVGQDTHTHPRIIKLWQKYSGIPGTSWIEATVAAGQAIESAKANGNPQLILHRFLCELSAFAQKVVA